EIDTSNLTLNYTTHGPMVTEEFNNRSCLNISSTQSVFAGVCLGISTCGLVGNGMVMWFLGFHMKRSPFTVYILNLAVADFSLTFMFFLLLVTFLVLKAFCSYLF
ncbi:MAS protein, partial [Calyptomena viridis]|nr:MAS protein [Calyptomena viridis]